MLSHRMSRVVLGGVSLSLLAGALFARPDLVIGRESRPVALLAPPVKLTSEEESALKDQAACALVTLSVARLGGQKALAEDVYSLALRVFDEETRLSRSALAVARRSSVALPVSLSAPEMSQIEGVTTRINRLKGLAFDEAFLTELALVTEANAAQGEKALSGAKDENVRSFLTEWVRVEKATLGEAKALLEKTKRANALKSAFTNTAFGRN